MGRRSFSCARGATFSLHNPFALSDVTCRHIRRLVTGIKHPHSAAACSTRLDRPSVVLPGREEVMLPRFGSAGEPQVKLASAKQGAERKVIVKGVGEKEKGTGGVTMLQVTRGCSNSWGWGWGAVCLGLSRRRRLCDLQQTTQNTHKKRG